MQVQPITWSYIGKENCLWEGRTGGLLPHVKFVISSTGKNIDEYFVTTEFPGIENTTCIGIENAKEEAQRLLIGYVFAIIIP